MLMETFDIDRNGTLSLDEVRPNLCLRLLLHITSRI
jgi:hypothetical protein